MFREQNARRSHNIEIYNCSFERAEQFKYLGTPLTNQNCIQEEIKSRIKSGNVCYNSVQNLLSSSLLSKNLKIKIHRTIILSLFVGCETWSLTLRKEHKLKEFNRRVPMKKCGSGEEEEVTRHGENCMMRSFMIYIPHQMLFWR